MENWFKDVGRPALFDALTGVCNRIDNELDEGLKSYRDENAQLSAELENLRARASDADQFKEENLALKRELQILKNGSHASILSIDQSKLLDDARNGRFPLIPKSMNQVSNLKPSTKLGNRNIDGLGGTALKEEYLKLNGNYTKLHEKYLELEDAHAKLNQRLRDKTKAYNQWMDHANQLDELCKKRSRIIKKLEAKLDAGAAATSGPRDGSFSSDVSVPPTNTDQVAARESIGSDVPDQPRYTRLDPLLKETPLIWPPTNVDENGSDSPRRVSPPEAMRIKTASHISPEKNITTGSESCVSTVEGESYQLPPFPKHRNTNPREVLIKTEPSSDPPVIVSERCVRKRKHDDRQTENVTKVKTEDSSDPLIMDERQHFMPHESIDFDAEGGRVITPRKRNRTSLEFEDVSVSGSARVPGSHAGNNRLSRLEDPPVRNTTRKRALPPQFLLDENLDQAHVGNDLLAPRSGVFGPTAAIQEKPGGNCLTKEKCPSSIRTSPAKLAEDDARNKTPKTTKKRPKTGLQALLNTPSPGHDATNPSPIVQSDHARISRQFEFQAPQRRELPFSKNDSKKASKLPQSYDAPEASHGKRTPGNMNAKRPSDDREKGDMAGSTRPLRERPKSELSIVDFKINPNSNEGYDYAFTDVVRNKNERASLEGCVQEGCCGQTFRLQARAKRDQTGPVDFQILLEKHMGDEAWKLSTMTKAEKEDVWLEAKTRELANEHGKHRHRFHRAASPVGFWRADFPSTQEEQRDREAAAKATRRIIDERYREAMRPGGRWVFRDE
ncbi:SAE2-domain-containing protein [Daldinia decipiens]|uniref:SAE2-domain-containing protein n=1 Tax=Daldinia decipiens TaxID=326647 RepID=UPI0020C31537|nr:SAE2-domain-containing protein [Daldinia decipiens]KAI1662776.1 SAE2-domain-containing protein [Daldinia decipiens]